MPRIIKPGGEEEFPYEGQAQFADQSPAVAEANIVGQELTSIPLENVGGEYPSVNAMDRNRVYQAGGKILEYEQGGKVK